MDSATLAGYTSAVSTKCFQWWLCVLLLPGVMLAAADVDVSKLPPAATRPVDFARDIQPIFTASCLKCHGPEKQKGGFRVDVKDVALKGGENYAPSIHPGKSAESPLIHFVAGLVEDMAMPQKGETLSVEQIGLLRAWIDQGAVWPQDGRAEVDPIRSHWAFQPVVRPSVPVFSKSVFRNDAKSRTSSRNTDALNTAFSSPVDAFIGVKLSQSKLAPSREADRVTLIRRLYFVMLGMPPTP
ncbi:MAG: c-type cytochrome domain-containing protein, partial [Fimbriimonadaceae bacterium]